MACTGHVTLDRIHSRLIRAGVKHIEWTPMTLWVVVFGLLKYILCFDPKGLLQINALGVLMGFSLVH